MENKTCIILLLLLIGSVFGAVGDQEIGGNLILTGTGKTLRITGPNVPSGSTDTGTKGDISWDTKYIYICVADNTWKVAVISTWEVVPENVIYATENVIYADEQVVYP
jgi:hypothetical protein